MMPVVQRLKFRIDVSVGSSFDSCSGALKGCLNHTRVVYPGLPNRSQGYQTITMFKQSFATLSIDLHLDLYPDN